MKIAIVTHKDKCFLNNSIFCPVQVNAEKNNYVIDENYFLDNVGDNISIKNENYVDKSENMVYNNQAVVVKQHFEV